MRFCKNHFNNENALEFIGVKIKPKEMKKLISILNLVSTEDSIELKENFLRIKKRSEKKIEEKIQREKDEEYMLKAIDYSSKRGLI